MKKTIILHGHLAERYPEPIIVEAETVAEAIRSLETIEELKPENGSPWPIQIDEVDSDIALYAKSHISEIHVRPLLGGGGGRGGIAQILIGVALVAVGFVLGPGGAFLGIKAASFFLTGGLMITGGILQMLLPTPDGSSESESSKYLGASVNTVKIGTRIPIGYGNRKIGGHYLSFDVDAVDYADGDPVGGTPIVVDDSVYVEYDSPSIEAVPILPVFSSATPGLENIPTSDWSVAA